MSSFLCLVYSENVLKLTVNNPCIIRFDQTSGDGDLPEVSTSMRLRRLRDRTARSRVTIDLMTGRNRNSEPRPISSRWWRYW